MVDLEALKAELEAAGWTCEFYGDPTYGISIKGTKKPTPNPGWRSWLTVQNDGVLYVYGRFWSALDIIRKYASPPEPVVLTSEEREAIASAIYEVLEDNAKTRTCDTWREVNRKQASAVLDWLAANGFALVRTKAVADGA